MGGVSKLLLLLLLLLLLPLPQTTTTTTSTITYMVFPNLYGQCDIADTIRAGGGGTPPVEGL